jgi:hypothetical protein
MIHHLRVFALVPLVSLGCSPAEEPEPVDDDTQIGECGEPVYGIDLTITGLVEDASGALLEGAQVQLEERNWEPGTIHGTTTTDANGSFTMAATDLVDIPDCWGTALDYVVVVEFNGMFGEAIANQKLFNAIVDETYVADFSAVPILVE